MRARYVWRAHVARRRYTSSALGAKPFVVGIRAEDVARRWERRVPLVPSDVKALVDGGVPVLVQPSAKRCFTDDTYADAGATITPDLSTASLVVGVKEIPCNELLSGRDRTYAFFSHTYKGQAHNRPLLKRSAQSDFNLFPISNTLNANLLRSVGKPSSIH